MAKKKKQHGQSEAAAEVFEGQVLEGECDICLDAYGSAKCTKPEQHTESASEDAAQTES